MNNIANNHTSGIGHPQMGSAGGGVGGGLPGLSTLLGIGSSGGKGGENKAGHPAGSSTVERITDNVQRGIAKLTGKD
ncbi:hypothetical protein BOTBODRAFT_36869 [Botryobasidium botryosum FD-172 SS1]|uniref:Uncharacterized protein n=1 Tax=Botryobasidium botryosum (strain FD-172 SS1) TaxID=930990 RepID=A0A067MCL4_BOTB1|nr:hypothetical protein BOTBODRAFT_36869 [Botryobasidium botryosum FD-172 SS1]